MNIVRSFSGAVCFYFEVCGLFTLVLSCWLLSPCGRLEISGYATAELCRWSGEMARAYLAPTLRGELVRVRCVWRPRKE